MLQRTAEIADADFAPVSARVSALRSLAKALPDAALVDISVLPETGFLLRRFEDAGSAIVLFSVEIMLKS